jgi:DHA1 family inner membrane transport protein
MIRQKINSSVSGLRAPALVVLVLSIAGVAILLLSAALHVRQRDVVPA